MDPVPLQTRDGLAFWRRDDVALLREEVAGRLEATSSRGEVAHRPGPLDASSGPPLCSVGDGVLVHPRHARRDGDVLVLPGGWRLPWTGPLPDAPLPVPAETPLPGTDVLPSRVLYLQGRAGRAWWHTDHRRVAAGTSAEAAARLHPHLVKAGRGRYVNRLRLHAIRPERKRFRLVLDTGEELTVAWGAREALAAGLGLPHLYYLEPMSPLHESLYREGLRDWPWELYETPADLLIPALGDDERRCVANVIWQAYRYGEDRRPATYGRSERGFWYVPAMDVAVRAGFFTEATVDEDAARRLIFSRGAPAALRWAARGGADRHYALYLALMATMVGDYRLFDFEDIGLEDPRPDLRTLGAKRPDVVLVAEKRDLDRATRLIGNRHGVSTIILGGIPSLLSTEYFAKMLRAAGVSTVVVLAYVDFDPGGWIAISGFQAQLARYAIQVRHTGYLIRPSRFTSNEIALHAYPVRATTPQIGGKIEDWLAASGGIEGAPRGLHADTLPVDRVLMAFEEEVRAAGEMLREEPESDVS